MKVKLIDHTGAGSNEWYAAELLLFTKNTRLQMSPGLMQEIRGWSNVKKLKELEYMSNTIQSSLEFCDYTFLIEDCDRGFTHQLVRNRHGSYQQQTMRVLNVGGFGFNTGPTIEKDDNLMQQYCDTMATINAEYTSLIENGAAVEDARGILPTNIQTNIVAKFNLRTLSEIVAKRSSPIVQGAYRDFVNQMADEVLKVHPWCKVFLRNRKTDAAKKLDEVIKDNFDNEEAIQLIKLVDILRG